MTTLPEIIGAFISDAFELTGIHGGSVAGAAVGRYFRRRTEQARDILFEELRQANISDEQAASEDDAIAVIVRYLRAAREGAARLNLRLLAKAIAGKLRSGSLVADEFLQYAEALGSLSRDEIRVIGAMYRYWESTPRACLHRSARSREKIRRPLGACLAGTEAARYETGTHLRDCFEGATLWADLSDVWDWWLLRHGERR
jgi:hypothetical protein